MGIKDTIKTFLSGKTAKQRAYESSLSDDINSKIQVEAMKERERQLTRIAIEKERVAGALAIRKIRRPLTPIKKITNHYGSMFGSPTKYSNKTGKPVKFDLLTGKYYS